MVPLRHEVNSADAELFIAITHRIVGDEDIGVYLGVVVGYGSTTLSYLSWPENLASNDVLWAVGEINCFFSVSFHEFFSYQFQLPSPRGEGFWICGMYSMLSRPV